jgi:predicted phage terminase large subunit-like protein
MNERYNPQRVLIETVAAQEYLAQDAECFMPVTRVDRKKDKVSRAYWLQSFFENGQILFPAKYIQAKRDDWQALQDELILFPQAEHDDLFDALQTMVEGALGRSRVQVFTIGGDPDDNEEPWGMSWGWRRW